MRPLLVLSTLLAPGLALAQPLAAPTALTQAELGQLEKGEVVVHPQRPTDGKGIAAQSFGVVDAPTGEVWPVLRDCQHFSQFLPRTKDSAATTEDGATICHIELNMPFPLMNLWSDSRSVLREEPGGHYQRSWSLVRGTYRRNSGSWQLVPWGPEQRQTLIVYTLDSDPAILIPDAILRSAQVGSLPEVFKAIRKRVVALRK